MQQYNFCLYQDNLFIITPCFNMMPTAFSSRYLKLKDLITIALVLKYFGFKIQFTRINMGNAKNAYWD